MAALRAAYRSLLRAVDKQVTSRAGSTQWRDYVREEFRSGDGQQVQQGQQASAAGSGSGQGGGGNGGGVEGGPPQEDRLELARDLAYLINNIAHHRALLASYNIGVDYDERNKRMIEATARRVGFRLPDRPEPPQ